MIDHLGVPVSDIGRSRAFYEAALGPPGMSVQMEVDGGTAMGFGVAGERIFWTGGGKTSGAIHVAFRADRRDQVDAFHAASLKAGGHDNGAPGLRPNYGPNYYAAFVHDPDGANIEAVCYAGE